MKLLQFGESSSLFDSMKLETRGGNHDSIAWLQRLLLSGAGLDCGGDWETGRSVGRSSTSLPPLDKIASTAISLAVIVDDVLVALVASRSVDRRREGAMESSSSSSSLIFIKFNWVFLDVLPEDSRPSKQARAPNRFTRLVSELTEREADEADTDTTVLWVGLRSRVGESGSDGSVTKND